MQPSTLRIAVISAAHVHATSYLSLLAARSDIDVVLCDPDAVTTDAEGPRGADLAAQFGVEHVDEQALWAWRPDAVVICSENVHHRRWAVAAAEHGAHSLCEKPLATTPADAAAMTAAADAAAVRLMTAYPMRFAPEFAELLTAVRSGALGEIRSIRGTNNGKIPAGRAWFSQKDLAGGGALTDHVVHCADLIDALLAQMPDRVHAVSNAFISRPEGGVDVETAGLVTLTYPSGTIATIDCSWSRPQSSARWGDLTLTVEGTLGTVTIAPFADGVSGDLADSGAVWLGYGADTDALMLEEFISSIRQEREPWPDGQAGARTVRIVDAAYRSVASGSAVAPIA